MHFVDPETGAHTNAIESTWRHAKAKMNAYNRRKSFFAGYLAKYLFLKLCKSQSLDPTVHFFKMAAQVYNPNLPAETDDVPDEEEQPLSEEDEIPDLDAFQ